MEREFNYNVAEHELTLLGEEEAEFSKKAEDGGILYLFADRSFQSLDFTACIMWNVISQHHSFQKAKEEILKVFCAGDDQDVSGDVSDFFDFLTETGAIQVI